MQEMASQLHRNFLFNVRQVMDELGMSQVELATRLKVSRPYVNQILAGKWTPGLDLVERIAIALGASGAELLEEPTVAAK